MMGSMAKAEDLLTSSQAGTILGKSARTVSRLAQTGELVPAARMAAGNGVYLFRRRDVEKFAAKQAAKRTEASA